MANPTISALQNAINRYAKIAGFPMIGVDGTLGNQTARALVSSLAWVQANVSGEADTATSLVIAVNNQDGTYNLDQINSSAGGLTDYLNGNADEANLPTVNVATSSGGGGGNIIFPTNVVTRGGSVATDLVSSLQGLPTWAKIAGGLGLAYVGLKAFKMHKKSKKSKR